MKMQSSGYFNLGLKKDKYEHVILMCSTPYCKVSQINDHVGKGRKLLNASTGLGIKRDGLNMAVCNLLYWTVIIPMTLCGCELWVFDNNEKEKVELFQRQASSCFQRYEEIV